MKKLLILISIIAMPVYALAQVNWELSLNYHLGADENVYLEEPDAFLSMESALGFKGRATMPLGGTFVGGLFLGYIPSVGLEEADTDASLLEFGLMFGPNFEVGDMNLITTAEIGYRTTSVDESGISNLDGLGLNFNAALWIKPSESICPKVELGFITQPTGGNDDTSVTWSPYWYIGGGIVFNKW